MNERRINNDTIDSMKAAIIQIINTDHVMRTYYKFRSRIEVISTSVSGYIE